MIYYAFSWNLFQLSQHFLDSAHRLPDIVIAGGITHAETLRITEGITTNGGYMSFFQQVHCKIVGIVDGTFTIALSVEAAALREQVEGSLRNIHFQSGNVFGKFNNQVAATLKGLTHLFYAVLWEVVCSLGSFLADRARAAGILSLQFVAALDNPFWCGNVSNTPAGHRVCL